MAVKGMNNFSYEPVHTAEQSAPSVKAILSKAPDKDEDEAESPSNSSIIFGCGLVGWVIGGPFLAFLTALGGTYAAERNQGPIGDVARAVGRIAAAAGDKAQDEHIWCKVKAAIRSIFSRRNNCQCASCNNQGVSSKI